MTAEHLYRVRFFSQDKIYEIYARDVIQGELYGFVVLSELVFGVWNLDFIFDFSVYRFRI